MRNRTDHAAIARQAIAALADESERHRRDAGKLRLAGLVLIKYLERLAAGKTAGTLQSSEIESAIRTIRVKGHS